MLVPVGHVAQTATVSGALVSHLVVPMAKCYEIPTFSIMIELTGKFHEFWNVFMLSKITFIFG